MLQEIQKKPLGEIETVDFRGNVYDTFLYCLPKIQIKGLSYFEVIACEYREDFKANTILWTETSLEKPIEHIGLLGSHLLQRSNFLLDFPHSQLIFCNDLELLKKKGLVSRKSFQIPLKMIRKAFYLEMETDLGKKVFLLDTGFPISVLHDGLIKGSECMLDIPVFSSYLIAHKKKLGPISFYNFPLDPLFQCDGILGVSFFEENILYFNFQEKVVHLFCVNESIY